MTDLQHKLNVNKQCMCGRKALEIKWVLHSHAAFSSPQLHASEPSTAIAVQLLRPLLPPSTTAAAAAASGRPRSMNRLNMQTSSGASKGSSASERRLSSDSAAGGWTGSRGESHWMQKDAASCLGGETPGVAAAQQAHLGSGGRRR